MRTTTIATLLALGLAGCEPIATDAPPVPTTTSEAINDPAGNTSIEPVAPDNTAVNQRDAEGTTQTPIDQKETQADVNTTAEIRQRITAADGLSINAQNAKVVTENGKVTLRGPVESAAERDTLDRIAREVAGDANVDNQLEVSAP
jgi:osmotically-inducible protein OsmY